MCKTQLVGKMNRRDAVLYVLTSCADSTVSLENVEAFYHVMKDGRGVRQFSAHFTRDGIVKNPHMLAFVAGPFGVPISNALSRMCVGVKMGPHKLIRIMLAGLMYLHSRDLISDATIDKSIEATLDTARAREFPGCEEIIDGYCDWAAAHLRASNLPPDVIERAIEDVECAIGRVTA
ncbi:hypothetical protein P3T40_003557 [Paraburkholderia sp. EB58]|uniref:hypothetical protein n=1 Tax=Paraburkholderia sp. EB58 TaxID=3035125 RepID=UPI003D1F3DE5